MDVSVAGETKGVGAYSQYCVADEKISFKVPSSITREDASTVPLASATSWLALFSKDCLAINRTQADSEDTSVLIWGGSCMYSNGFHSVRILSNKLLQQASVYTPFKSPR